jgi:hypothetical protein
MCDGEHALTNSPIVAQIAVVKRNLRRRKRTTFSTLRWSSYATAAGATAVVALPTADCEIHYSGLINFKLNQRSPGTENHTFPLSQGLILRGFRYVNGALDNSATLFMTGAAVSSAFRIYSPSFAETVAASLPRGEMVSRGPFNHFGIGRLQD